MQAQYIDANKLKALINGKLKSTQLIRLNTTLRVQVNLSQLVITPYTLFQLLTAANQPPIHRKP